MTPGTIKTTGYLISTLSVVLLALPAGKTAVEHPLLAVCLAGGVTTSICGMALRWYSYRKEKSEPKK
jgi:hypothetical protein